MSEKKPTPKPEQKRKLPPPGRKLSVQEAIVHTNAKYADLFRRLRESGD